MSKQAKEITPASYPNTLKSLNSSLGVPVNVKHYGAVGDGVTDDTAALTSALNCGAKKVFIPNGTYKVTSQIIITVDKLEIYGSGKILIDFENEYCFRCGNRSLLKIDGLFFDGNHKSKGAIIVGNTNEFYVSNCTFYDFRATVTVYAIAVGTTENCVIEKCKFNKLWSEIAPNGTGVVRGIYVYSTNENVIIKDCHFYDIHSVTSEDVVDYQDADAIQCQATSGIGYFQNVKVESCFFENIGKRAIKFQGDVGCNYVAKDCVISSSWTSEDDESAVGMYSAISHYAGNCYIDNIKFLGGACAHFLEIVNALVETVHVKNCLYIPEVHSKVRTLDTRAIYHGGLNPNSSLIASNNIFKNIKVGIDQVFSASVICNQIFLIATGGSAVRLSGGICIVSNNILNSLNTSAGQGIYVGASTVDGVVISGNHIKGFQDSLNIQAQEASSYVFINGNTLTGMGRYPLGGYTEAANIYLSDNFIPGAIRNEDVSIPSITAANIGDAANNINTLNKRVGKIIIDSTNGKMMFATGTLTTSNWSYVDGSGNITPS